MYQLRNYQKQLLNKILESVNKNKYICASAPTGAGKTIIILELIKELIKKKSRIMFIVNREELVLQSLDKFKEIAFALSVIKAGIKYKSLYNTSKLVQICMIQTWHASKIQDLDPDYIIIDECHEGFQATRISDLLEMYPSAKVIGVSATPIDDKGYLIPGFDDYIQEIFIKDLIDQGFLVQPRVLSPYLLDLSNVKINNFDYNVDDLEEVVIQDIKNVIKHFKNHAARLKTIVFATSIKHAEELLIEFKSNEFKAEILHSQIDNLDQERQKILNRFKKGDTQIVINVGILTTGFDEPTVECILLLRPTKILKLYLQIVGRGLRPYVGKKECLIIDCANIVNEHGTPEEIRIFQHKPPKQNGLIEPIFKKCPQCEAMIAIATKICPYCEYKFISEDIKPISKKEADKLQQVKCMQSEVYQEFIKLVKNFNYKPAYAWFLFKDVIKIKPAGYSSVIYYKVVKNKMEIIKAKNHKPASLIFKLKEQYNFKGELESIMSRKKSNV